MRVLICPDKFAGTASAPEAAAAIAEGWRDAAPDDAVTALPLADGGPGTLDALRAALGGEPIVLDVFDPLGRKVKAAYLRVGDTAYIESAQACGLHLLAADERDPLRATSFGLGQLMLSATEHGARALIIGLGGSATNDAGAGMLTALGLAARDAAGRVVGYGGAALAACERLDGAPLLRGARLIAATDVDNPLCGPTGASAVFGPQKGATEPEVRALDHALDRFARVLARDLDGCPPDVAALPGSGAAGGIGAALFALGARRESGADLIARAVSLDAALDACDLVITGEGSFDAQSLRGKLISNIAAAARLRNKPCLVLAGRVAVDPAAAARLGVTEARSLTDHFGSADEAMNHTARGLREMAADAAHRPR